MLHHYLKITHPQTINHSSTVQGMLYSVSIMPATRVFGQTQTSAATPLNYGEGNYNSNTYSGQSSGGGAAGGLSNGGLGQTGTSILFVMTISAVILFCSLLWIIFRRPGK